MRNMLGGGGNSIISKGHKGLDKRKLMQMSGEDRYALITAHKTAELQKKMVMKNFESADGVEKLNGKAKKMINMMIENNAKKQIKKVEAAIALKEKQMKAALKAAMSGPTTTAAQKAAAHQAHQAATQDFLKKMYNTDGINKPSGDGWW